MTMIYRFISDTIFTLFIKAYSIIHPGIVMFLVIAVDNLPSNSESFHTNALVRQPPVSPYEVHLLRSSLSPLY